ncbi:peptidoglycan-binding domain-containing protein [Ancylobacter defluvii]|uniref:Peptidoglycan binding-like domain-containing protein n=1 Tax=Ancylobacter defluvii TaxID=1282440 RepID=A0A9W6JW28_9HYPH|nr:peptidoglycan-binding domain-containing protein [Ancylobacter defluvii]MBS7589332.1 peptidoglycan-binding protein [Ancylobacter defluvii]GLK84945.1 hypothetical protein GCM10017653_30150 [Ancylobacter defluvii]
MPRSYASDLLVDGIDLGAQRGLVVPERPRHRRSDLFMVLMAAAASAAVLANAFVFQEGRRESGGTPVPPPAPTASRPAAASPSNSSPVAAAPVARTSEPVTPPAAAAMPLPPVKPPVPKPAAKADAGGIGALVGAAASASPTTAAPVRPPAEVAISARMLEVQKALARLGYGPIRIDGRASEATEKAIKDFERDRRLPVTGQVSDRLVRELNAVAGFSIQ